MARHYEFTRPMPQTPNTSSTSASVRWTMTTRTPNPFRGVDRLVFAVDEWGHRSLGRFHRPLMGWLCDWWDRRLIG